MNTRNFIFSCFGSTIVMWLLAGLAHEIVFAQFFAEATDAKHEGTAIIFIAYLALGLLMNFLYITTHKAQTLCFGRFKAWHLCWCTLDFPSRTGHGGSTR